MTPPDDDCGVRGAEQDRHSDTAACVWNRVRGLGDAHFPHHFLLPVFAVCAVLGSLGQACSLIISCLGGPVGPVPF
jgi:hypothetical protein